MIVLVLMYFRLVAQKNITFTNKCCESSQTEFTVFGEFSVLSYISGFEYLQTYFYQKWYFRKWTVTKICYYKDWSSCDRCYQKASNKTTIETGLFSNLTFSQPLTTTFKQVWDHTALSGLWSQRGSAFVWQKVKTTWPRQRAGWIPYSEQ